MGPWNQNFSIVSHYEAAYGSNEENLMIEFLQNTAVNSVLLALRLSLRQFQMALEGLSFSKTLATFGIIYATDPLLQNMTKTVCLR